MSESRAKSRPRKALEDWRAFLLAYESALDRILRSIPEKFKPGSILDLVLRRRYEMWPCTDGTVVLGFPAIRTEVVERPAQNGKMTDFIATGRDARFSGPSGEPPPRQPFFGLSKNVGVALWVASPGLIHDRVRFRPRWTVAILAQEGANPGDPERQALDAAQTAYATKHFPPSSTPAEQAESLVESFRAALDSEPREEEIQLFLKTQPTLLSIDHISVIPKFSLANDFVTDFVVVRLQGGGPEYTFVEIEKPSLPFFRSNEHLRSEFTHACGQIAHWKTWLDRNWSWASQKLPGVANRRFQIVYGRSKELDEAKRETIRQGIPSDVEVVTYDDLAERLLRSAENLTHRRGG